MQLPFVLLWMVGLGASRSEAVFLGHVQQHVHFLDATSSVDAAIRQALGLSSTSSQLPENLSEERQRSIAKVIGEQVDILEKQLEHLKDDWKQPGKLQNNTEDNNAWQLRLHSTKFLSNLKNMQRLINKGALGGNKEAREKLSPIMGTMGLLHP
mmetsp:Transcript_26006/g.39527  ORF Transcript_26006/g.39527 Transcript_26006/m.39527 type:complete len:154 (+) Transcript_26006:52-513(+)